MNTTYIGSRREVFWDDTLIESSRTTAVLTLHHPRIEEIVYVHDAPWEGDGCNSYSIVKDGDLYRLYYCAWETMNEDCTAHLVGQGIRFCCIESTDGIHWTRPSLGICEFNGSTDNNIILDDSNCNMNDQIFVFIDENPDCPPAERYKAIGADFADTKALFCYISADGLHFQKGWKMTDQGAFDTHNIAFWSPEHHCYFSYIRDLHDYEGTEKWTGIRDIRVMTSKDFKNWTVPEPIDFGGGEDYALYSNEVLRYPRAPHMFIGFPLRYMERKVWTDNVTQLPNPSRREKLSKVNPRYGLAVTDTAFMTSRDGLHFHRFDEAFLSPGIERGYNWVYGDSAISGFLLETPSSLKYAPEEYSIYVKEKHWSGEPAEMRRYTIRKDGFCSYSAPYGERKVLTRSLIYDGSKMELNFSTSAYGYVYIKIHGKYKTISSCELYGNALDRIVPFDGDLSELAGQKVTLEFTLCDADLYSFRFFHK